MAFIYRQNLGRNLTATEGDANFTEAETRLAALESDRPQPDELASVALVADQLSFYLGSGTQLGPVTIPMPRWRSRGEWLPATIYAVLDVVTVEDSGLYVVLLDHTSAATFDPDALSGGNPIYDLLVPAGVNLTLSGLADVTITGIADDDFIAWDSGAALWTNRTSLATLTLLTLRTPDLPIAGSISGSPPGGLLDTETLIAVAEPDGLSPAGYTASYIRVSDIIEAGAAPAVSDATLPLDGDNLIPMSQTDGASPATYTSTRVRVFDLLAVGNISGLCASVAAFLATPSSANLAAAVTGETGTGALVFGTSPSLITPALGVASATSLTSPDVILGTSFAVGGVTASLRNSTTNGFGQGRFSANATGASFRIGKSRGSVSTAGAVTAGDRLLDIIAYGDDGSTNGDITVGSAIIRTQVIGTVSTGVVPAFVSIQTMNAAGTLAERWRTGAEGGFAVGTTTDPGAGCILASATIKPGGYTVATLPAAGTAGRRAYVTDALAPAYLVAIAGGGAAYSPVQDTGAAWVSA